MSWTCSSPSPLSFFDALAYTGTWYEQVHTAGTYFLDDSHVCITADYHNLDQTTNQFSVYNYSQDEDFSTPSGIQGTGYCPNDNTGWCYVSFYTTPTEPNYLVVDTDYASYTIVYACDSLVNNLAILTRQTEITDDYYNQILDIAKTKVPDFDFDSLNNRTYQGDKCTYYQYEPEYQPYI